MLEPKTSIGVGLATMGLVAWLYDQTLPEVTDIRAAEPGDSVLAGAEHAARWASAGLVLAVTAITRDPTVFVLGGAAVITLSWLHRHANVYNPTGGSVSLPSSRITTHDGEMAGYSPQM